jgi:antitoxin component of MazEF toxin-antitoxin module
MQATIKRWGNRAAVRIPTAILGAARVKLDQPVDIREEAGSIVIEPNRPLPRYTLQELVACCDRNKRLSREERQWIDAPRVGREAL